MENILNSILKPDRSDTDVSSDNDEEFIQDQYGTDWFQYCDDVTTKLHEIIADETLPKTHILYKLLCDVVDFVHTNTMRTGDCSL